MCEIKSFLGWGNRCQLWYQGLQSHTAKRPWNRRDGFVMVCNQQYRKGIFPQMIGDSKIVKCPSGQNWPMASKASWDIEAGVGSTLARLLCWLHACSTESHVCQCSGVSSYPRLWVCRWCLIWKDPCEVMGQWSHISTQVWWLGQHPVSDRCQNLKNTVEVEIKLRVLYCWNDCGGISIVERWKSFQITLCPGLQMHFSGMRNTWVWSEDAVNWFWGRVSWFYQWSMRSDQSLLWAHLLSWVCSGKMQASAYLYPTEPTEPVVKGKEGHYPVSVYWAGSHWG